MTLLPHETAVPTEDTISTLAWHRIGPSMIKHTLRYDRPTHSCQTKESWDKQEAERVERETLEAARSQYPLATKIFNYIDGLYDIPNSSYFLGDEATVIQKIDEMIRVAALERL